MARKYRVTTDRPRGLPPVCVTYWGMNKKFDATCEYVAAVRIDGEVEWWALDDRDNVSGLRQMLADQGHAFEIIGVFKRES